MSTINPNITHTDVIPVIESRLFDDHATSRFAMGILATNDVVRPGLEAEYRGYYDLRRNVYVEQTSQLTPEDINPDGTDRDIDDSRSIAMGIIENIGSGQARVVATMREIIKGAGADEGINRPLPVEEFSPDMFGEAAATGSVEISRMIARHERARYQDLFQKQLWMLGTACVMNHDLGRVFAVVEEWYQGVLAGYGVPFTAGEPVYIPHYLDDNTPIEIDVPGLKKTLDAQHPGAVDYYRQAENDFTYFGHATVNAPDGIAA